MAIEHIFIDKASVSSEVAQRVMSVWAEDKWSIVDGEPLAEQKGRLSSEQFDRSKKLLHITPFKGKFFKRCPGSRPGLTCCNYFVLNLGLQCDMNCSYCYLQSFINTPIMKLYSNIDDALGELREMGTTLRDQSMRIGTGEVIDSLSLDEISLYSQKLIGFFKDYPNWRLEFKTKSNKVDQFLDVPHAGNVIASWSINPQAVIASEEHQTASLQERLEAARKARDKGFQVSFHIDPMIEHIGWEKNYPDLVDQICADFSPKEIPYVSVGALRFQPEQRHMMRDRFGGKSLVNQSELFPGHDGKYRYESGLRKRMYQSVLQAFKNQDPQWKVFICMENPETWLANYEAMPKSVDGLSELFDHKPIRKFNSIIESSKGSLS